MSNLININWHPANTISACGSVIVCLLLLIISETGNAQTEFVPIGSFRYFNTNDTHSKFLESESRLLPGIKDSTFSITIIVKNIRNKSGVIRFKFFVDNNRVLHDTGFLRIVVPKSQVINNTYVATYHGFIPGYMGIALHDDENSNKKLDFEWFVPVEGYAFSDYYHTKFRRPNFEDFRFLLNRDCVVTMVMRYH